MSEDTSTRSPTVSLYYAAKPSSRLVDWSLIYNFLISRTDPPILIVSGDLLMVQADLGAPLGAKIILQKLLALGARDFTLLGRPVLPLDLANVEATVIEKTLSRTKVIQAFKPRSRVLRYRFNRVKWTLLRVNSINVTGRVGQTLDKSGMDKSLL